MFGGHSMFEPPYFTLQAFVPHSYRNRTTPPTRMNPIFPAITTLTTGVGSVRLGGPSEVSGIRAFCSFPIN